MASNGQLQYVVHPPVVVGPDLQQLITTKMDNDTQFIGVVPYVGPAWLGGGGRYLVCTGVRPLHTLLCFSHSDPPHNRAYLHPITLVIRHNPDLERGTYVAGP